MPSLGPPELIIVLDAKYSSEAHTVKLDEFSRKYGKIGVFRTGRVLSRQVWAMTPMLPHSARRPIVRDWATSTIVLRAWLMQVESQPVNVEPSQWGAQKFW